MAVIGFMQIKDRIPPLDGLRGMAILMVMLHHFTFLAPGTLWENWFVKIFHKGGHGVDLFFVLSGFLITGILMDTKDRPHYFRNFYMRRFLRIFPLYYVFILTFLFIVPPILSHIPAARAQWEDLITARNHWPWYVGYASNFWIAIKGYYSRGAVDITWSLAIEEHFYLIWPLIIASLKRQRVASFCLSVAILAFLCRSILWAGGFSPTQIYVLTFTRMDAIAFGGWIAALARLEDNPLKKMAWFTKFHIWTLGLALLVFLGAAGHLAENSAFFNTAGYSLIAIFFAQLLAILILSKPGEISYQFFTHPVLVFLGKYSYAMYLFHLPVGALLRDILHIPAELQKLGGPLMVWQMVYYVIAVAAVTPFVLLSWNVLEKPMISLKKYF